MTTAKRTQIEAIVKKALDKAFDDDSLKFDGGAAKQIQDALRKEYEAYIKTKKFRDYLQKEIKIYVHELARSYFEDGDFDSDFECEVMELVSTHTTKFLKTCKIEISSK